MAKDAPGLSPGLDAISSEACFLCNVSDEELRSVMRAPAITLARRLIVATARAYTFKSFPQIQKYVSLPGRGHSSSIYMYRRFFQTLEANEPVKLVGDRQITPQEAWAHMRAWAVRGITEKSNGQVRS